MSFDGILVAKESFMFEDDLGRSSVVHKGATVRVGHPILVGREDLFEPFQVDFEHEAPARPGRHAAKKAAAPALKAPQGGDS